MPLHKIWWLWVPLVGFAILVGNEFIFDNAQLVYIMSERGQVELVQFIILVLAAGVSGLLLLRMRGQIFSWLGAWVVLAFLSCIYVGGEEISWGQHYLNWDTPEYWKSINDQNETNLHNTSSWLDQKPRMVLHLGIILGGIVVPLLIKFKPGVLPARFAVIYPPAQLMPVSLLVVVPYVVDKMLKIFATPFFHRVSEIQELYMYYFVLLYKVTLYRRVVDKRV